MVEIGDSINQALDIGRTCVCIVHMIIASVGDTAEQPTICCSGSSAFNCTVNQLGAVFARYFPFVGRRILA